MVVADGRYMHTGEGLHRFVDPVDDEVYLYTQFEVPDSRRMFAVFEQPDLKAAFRFTVTAPAHWEVVSNSPTPEPPSSAARGVRQAAVGVRADAAHLDLHHRAHRRAVRRGARRAHAPTAASSRSACSAAESLAVPRRRLHLREDASRASSTSSEVRLPYPFAKYDQLFVPEFNAGAMENAGAVTFTEFYVFRSKVTDAVLERRVVTILHELAHMWFGDLVTMRWWNDLWLNESFAEWASTIATAEATEWTEAWTTFNSMEKSWAYRQDQLPSTHPIVADINDLEDVQVNFDGITYAKGGSVLKQLVAWVGVDAFFAGVSAYFRKHGWGNTDARRPARRARGLRGRDLSGLVGLWLETAGVNTLRPEIVADDDGVITSFAVLQSATDEHPTIRPHRLAIGFYDLDRRASSCATTAWSSTSTARAPRSPNSSGLTRPDLVLLNDDDLAYAKIRSTRPRRRRTREPLGDRRPARPRLVWGSVWDATRDAETRARDYLALVLGNIASETESTTLRIVLANAMLAASAYTAPERHADASAVADGFWRLASQAEPGSDAQFQFVMTFAAIAEAGSHVDELAALYDGTLELDGLEIDTDLGWELLVALAAAAAPAMPRSTRDSPPTTPRPAAGRRARPGRDPDARGQGARLVVAHRRRHRHEHRRARDGRGLPRASDPTLLEAFVERYFAMLEDVWEERTYAIAEKLVDGLYPSPLANRALADASRAWLDSHPDVPALRRLVIERLAGIDRALAAQARDAQDA